MRQFGSSSRVLNRVLSKGAAQQFATTEQKISRITASQPQRSLLSILICGTLLSGCVGSTVSTTLETAALNSPESEETTFSPESVDPNTQLTKIPVPVRSPVSSELALAPASQTTTVAEATSEVIAEQSTQTPAQTVAAAKPTPSPAATLTKQTKPAEEQLASAAKPKTKTAEKPTGFFAALFGGIAFYAGHIRNIELLAFSVFGLIVLWVVINIYNGNPQK